MLATERGQATLETIVASFSLLFLTGLLLVLIYFCALGTYLPYASHEFLVCREISDPWNCEKDFKNNLKTLMRWGRLDSIWVQKENRSQKIQVRMSFTVFQKRIQWQYQEQIRWP